MTDWCDINISLNKKIYVCDPHPKVIEGVCVWGGEGGMGMLQQYQLDPVKG